MIMSDDDNNNDITNIMPDHPELIAMSQAAKDFKSSEIGKYLLDRAAVKAGNAAKLLCTVDPTDVAKIVEYQGDAKILTILDDFINEAINTGDAEYANYQQKLNAGDD